MKATTSTKSTTPTTATERAQLIFEFANDMKAERVEMLDIRRKTSVADYFVICTGNSDTHMRAIAERVQEKLREVGVRPLRTDQGGADSGWSLLDFGDVVFHVMLEDKRQFYDLESLWESIQPDPNLVD